MTRAMRAIRVVAMAFRVMNRVMRLSRVMKAFRVMNKVMRAMKGVMKAMKEVMKAMKGLMRVRLIRAIRVMEVFRGMRLLHYRHR